MQLPLLFEKIKWPEIEKLMNDGLRTLVIPFGPVEEHGPHMGLGVDYIRPEEVAIRAGKQAPFFIHPTLPIGVLTKSRNFPGSVSVEPETLEAVMKDIFESCKRWGMKHVVFLTGHGGSRQIPMTNELVTQINNQHKDIKMHCLQISELNRKEQEKNITRSLAIHAAEQETSEMLYERPDIVEMDKAVKELPNPNKIQDCKTARENWKSGVRGDATIATKEKGEKLLQIQVEAFVEFIKNLNSK